MALPDGYTVEAEIRWTDDHPDQYEASRQLANGLDGAGFTVLVDEANDRHLLASKQEGDD